MEKILLWIFGIACLIQLLMIIEAFIRNKIIDKQNQEMESEI
jgi:hypothetical protein